MYSYPPLKKNGGLENKLERDEKAVNGVDFERGWITSLYISEKAWLTGPKHLHKVKDIFQLAEKRSVD